MKNDKTILLIVNQHAGQKKSQRCLADIIGIFNKADYRVQTYITAEQGDGETAVIRYAADVDLVVCCGGDGTLNETISGVLKSGKNLPIGYIPAGSTNDFASSLRLSGNVVQAANDIVESVERPLDIGCFCGRYFSYIASFGIFTKASYTTPQSMKNVLGHAAYVLSGIQELTQIKTYPLQITFPDGTMVEDDFLFGAIANSTKIAGMLTLSDEMVDLNDGLMELLLIRKPKNLIDLANCVIALQNQSYDSDMIVFRKASGFEITAPEDMDWTLDGEHEPGHVQIQVECLHHAVRFLQAKQNVSSISE